MSTRTNIFFNVYLITLIKHARHHIIYRENVNVDKIVHLCNMSNLSHFRHLLIDSGVTTTTIQEAVMNASSKIIVFAIPKGCRGF